MLNGDRANFLRRVAARDAGDGAAGQQLAARFDVGSSKQQAAYSRQRPCAERISKRRPPRGTQQQAARGHDKGGHGGGEREARGYI